MTPTARVLIVDNDRLFLLRAHAALSASVELQIVSSRDDALTATRDWRPDVVVVGSMMEDVETFSLLDEIRDRCLDDEPGVVYLTKGPGASQRLHHGNGTFLGMIRRDSGIEGLTNAVACAIGAVVGIGLLAG
jgi:CheY-like chemotaxis protein